MEQQSKELTFETTPLLRLRNASPPRPRDGVALVIVLGFLVLLTVLVVAFFTSVTSEYSAAKTYAAGASTRFLSESAVNVVMAQIAKGTQGQQAGATARYTWASQPGMIRTYDDQGGIGSCYKLYSSATMVIGANPVDVPGALAADVPAGWNVQPANYTDLNAPVIDSNGKLNFPILDGNLKQIQVDGTTILTYDDDGDGVPDIEGFSILPDSVPNYNSQQPISATNNPAPMPVQWLYLLKDGTLTVPDLPAPGSTVASATWKSAKDPAKIPTAANPIVGRIAFWTDDETCKLNVNTASEGSYYAFPHTNSPTEMQSSVKNKTFGFAASPPATGEYNRYRGHPAATCLSVALGNLMGANHTSVPTAYSAITDDTAYLNDLQSYMKLVPRNEYGGSMAGTVNAAGGGLKTVTLDSDRLFASVDEMIFTPSMGGSARQAFAQLQNTDLERVKFFLTASGRAPELTPFNTPKVSLWPQWATQADRSTYGYNTANGGSPTSSLLAFCSSFGSGATSPSGKNEYFFQRNAANPSKGVPSWQSSVQDWDSVPRNQLLANYIYKMGSQTIPGYHGSFVSANKYSVNNFSSLIVESMDFLRCNVGRLNYTGPSGANENYVAPLVVHSGLPGATATTPLKGFGEYPVITQICVGIGTPGGMTPMPFLIFNVFCPAQSLPGINQPFSIEADNLGNLGIPPLPGQPDLATAPSKYKMDLWDWKNNKTPTMRGYGWALSVPNSSGKYYSFNSLLPTLTIGTGNPVVFRTVDAEGNTIQKITVKFPATTVPTPKAGQYLGGPWYTYGGPISSMFSLSNGDAATLRGLECAANNAIKGDYRTMGALYEVSQINGTEIFTPSASYNNASYTQAHTLRLCDYYDSGDSEPTFGNNVSWPKTNTITGSLSSLLKNVDYRPCQAPCVPYGMLFPTINSGQPGDWDTGPGLQPDGPYINPTSQTFVENGGVGIYFESNNVGKVQNGVAFSPNRMVASAVKFGSLPTGIDPAKPKPWQTLLFCPNPAARTTVAGGTPTGADHIGFVDPPDHLYLEFFTMPVVEPYAISEPLSTAGKVNLNYQMAPFANITRSTALRGVLKNTLMAGISGYDVKDQNYKLGADAGSCSETRYEINRDATLAGLEKHFFNAGTLFRYPSEICTLFLVPKRIAGATYHPQAVPPPTKYEDMVSWWSEKGGLGTMSLTGDNLREEPYDHIYPRLTTKSNSYTVHYRVQRLQKIRSTKVDEWVEGRDVIVADQRGSSLIERYLDPNDAGLNATWDTNTMNLNFAASNLTKNTPDLSQYYKFRVINSKQFAP